MARLGHEENVVGDGMKRYDEHLKLITNILKVINPLFSEQNIKALRDLGLFYKGKKRPLKVTFINKQMVTDVIRKSKVPATNEEYEKIWTREILQNWKDKKQT